jgi:hypothetical protein
MSKKYRGKTCVYCGVPGSSECGDHVLAREFVLVRHRKGLPIVPACGPCNTKKSKLETSLTVYLPFGARHQDAPETLSTLVPKRLTKQPKIRAHVEQALDRSWFPSPQALFQPREIEMLMPADEIEAWVSMVCAGLIAFHWGVIVAGLVDIEPILIPTDAEPEISLAFRARASHRVGPVTIGGGALTYEGVMDETTELGSAWRLQVYGGIQMGGEEPGVRGQTFLVTVRPRGMRDQAGDGSRGGLENNS